ncbi:MAG: glycosyltransferase, partial [Gemmatimonadota bacterium]
MIPMTLLTLSLGLLALLSLATTLGFATVAWRTFETPRSHGAAPTLPADGDVPAISVLKPLKGVTPELYDNLAAFARQRYPRFELVLGTTDPDDPAVKVAERLARDFPRVPIRLVARAPRGAAARGFNPKVVNLAQIEAGARHDLVLVSDADVRPDPHYLRRLAAALRPIDGDPRPVGLVTNGLIPDGEAGVGAALETLHQVGFVT